MVKKMFLGFLAVVFLAFPSMAEDEWQEAKTEHFIVLYKKAPERFIDSVLKRSEEIYENTTTTLGFTRYKGWIWGERVKITIYDDADDYKNSDGYGWSGGVVKTATKSISTYPAAHGFFDSVLPHELGHIIFREFIGPEVRVPLWLEEGVAMYQEEGKRWGADSDVKKAISDGRFIGLRDLSSLELTNDSDRGMVDLFYAEAASLVNFLIEEGEMYRFARLCREIKDENRFEWALKKAYMKYQKLEDLEEAWKGYLGQ